MGSSSRRGLRSAIRGVCFVYASFFWTFFLFLFGVLALVPDARRGRLSYYVFRLWAWGFVRCFSGRVRVEHAERMDARTPRLIVANHASWLDPPALIWGMRSPLRIVMKDELMRVPFVGIYGKLAGHFLLDRDDPREAQKLFDRAVERVRTQGISPMVFPEGTRSLDGRLLPLRPGVFQFALAAGIEVQPVAILGSFDLMPKGAIGPLSAREIVLRVGEPISVAPLTGSRARRELAARVTDALHALGVP